MPEVAKVHLENLCGRSSLTLRNHSESSQFCELPGRESAGIGSDLPIKSFRLLGRLVSLGRLGCCGGMA